MHCGCGALARQIRTVEGTNEYEGRPGFYRERERRRRMEEVPVPTYNRDKMTQGLQNEMDTRSDKHPGPMNKLDYSGSEL